jgi:pimeloyl-ACP methyl ester carboxylesterase
MRKPLSTAWLICWLLVCSPVRADVMVLVHGWAADANTWATSHVMMVLLRQGWQDSGVLQSTPAGVVNFMPTVAAASHSLYRVSLPAQAPIMVQAQHFLTQLDYIKRRHAHENIAVVAHSAGGIVARLALTHQDAPAVNSLITIATPHLGSRHAVDGLAITHAKPFFCPGPGMELMKSVVGGQSYRYLRGSAAVLADLVPEGLGGLLDWLNRLPHPDIAYHSVIKQIPGHDGDEWISARSQDMNQVAGIQGRSGVHISLSSHALVAEDGLLIHSILQH